MRRRTLPPRMHAKGRWYWHVTSTRPRIWTKLSTIDEGLARARLLWAQKEGGTIVRAKTLAQLSDAYLESELGRLAPETQRRVMREAAVLCRVFGRMAIESIEPHHVATYLDTHRSPQAANSEISLLSTMYGLALRRGWAKINPCIGVRRNARKPRRRYITNAEYKTLWQASSPLVRAVMDLSYLTGSRQSDVLKIRLADIQPDGLHVEQQKTGARQRYDLTPALLAAIERAKALRKPIGSLYLIANSKGQPYTQRAFQKFWTREWAATAIADVHFHDIRAKAATDANRLGRDYQALLGHASRAMSDRYVRVRAELAVEPLPPVEGW